MGISNQIPNSRIAQAGVVPDTANRPASPFEGQMLYQKDTNQVLVYDGSAWVAIADTDAPPALQLVKAETFTSQTAVNIDNCFTSEFANYQVIVDLSAISANDTVLFLFRDSAGTVSLSNYDYTLLEYYNGSVAATSSLAVGNSRIQYVYTTPGYMAAVINIFNPQSSTLRTQWSSSATSQNGTTWTLVDKIDGHYRTTASMTGFRLENVSGTATMTGTIRIYGYRN